MPDTAAAYLVIRQDDGRRDSYALTPGERYTLGRATTNRIVLKDELCSREHAEIYYANGRWHLRDLNTLNGTHVNDTVLDSEWHLSPLDAIRLGRTRLVFVHQVEQLQDLPIDPTRPPGLQLKTRLGHT